MIINADCLEALREMADSSVTAIVTDPPYALEFMGKGWDKVLPSVDIWRECLRVLKPGGVLLAFGGTRTFHRLTCSIEDSGFQIRDCLSWLYGSGFPKSLDISKAIDKADGVERPRVAATGGLHKNANLNDDGWKNIGDDGATMAGPEPGSDRSRPWVGHGTALKPAWEPIVFAMKPTDGTFAANALAHGVAGINVDGCRVGLLGGTAKGNPPKGKSGGIYGDGINGACDILDIGKGRWPANVVHDGSDEVVDVFPDAPGNQSAARFFYCAKASKKDRGEGNTHPTVKPITLMRWLVRMVKMPEGAVVLDPFMGSGTTGVACRAEGVDFVGVERDPTYFAIAKSRI